MATGNSFLNEVFAIAYLDWCRTGNIPDFASKEVTDILKLQRKRFEKWNVTLKCESEIGKENEISKYGYLSSNRSNRQTANFFSIIRQNLFFRRLIYVVNGQVGYNAYQKDVLVTTATNKKNTSNEKSNISGTETASWPQITDFYIYPHARQNPVSGKLEFLFITLPCMVLTFFYIAYISNLGSNLAFVPFMFTLFGALFFGLLIGFLVWMPIKMFTMMAKAKKALRTNTPRSKYGQQIYTLLKPVIPDFNYEYFASQLMTMLQTIIYSDVRMNLSCYRGKDSLAELDNIIEINNNLKLKILSNDLSKATPTLTLQTSVITYRVKGNKVEKKNEKFILELCFQPQDDELAPGFWIQKFTKK